MADDPNIDISLKTTADTKGAEETQDALQKVDKAALEAQRHQDVATAQQRVAAKAAKENAEALREIADGQQRIIAANLASAVAEIGKQFRGVTPEIDMVIDSTQNFLSVLASTGNPVTALLALTATAIGAVMDAEKNASQAVTASEKKVEESFKRLRAAREAWATQVRTDNLEGFFRRELDALEDEEAALERIVKIRAAERDLAAAQQRAAGAAATRAGGDPFAAEAQNLLVEKNNQIAAIRDGLAASKAEVSAAEQEAITLKARADQLAAALGAGDGKAEQARKAAYDAAKNAERLMAALPDLQQVAAINVAKIQSEFEADATALADKAGRVLAAKAKAQIEAVQAKAAESGEGVSLSMQGIIGGITKIVSDGLVESKELPALAEQLKRISATRESNDQSVIQGFSKVVTLTETLTSLLPGLKSRIATLEADVATLRNAPQ